MTMTATGEQGTDARPSAMNGHTPEAAAAIAYTKLELAVFPIHRIRPDGRCGCGGSDCADPGKHPATTGWQRTIPSLSAVRSAWRGSLGDRGIGMACGPRSGCFAVDVDPRHGGKDTLSRLLLRHGPLPRTWTAETGSGGWHLFFRWPEGAQIRSSASRIGAGIDVRGDGGFVVLPPSLHVSGERYRWVRAPDALGLADPPAWLLTLVKDASQPRSRDAARDAAMVPRGQWHNALVSLGGVMRRWGAGEQVIDAALVAFAEHQFLHDGGPVDWAHVHETAADIARRY